MNKRKIFFKSREKAVFVIPAPEPESIFKSLIARLRWIPDQVRDDKLGKVILATLLIALAPWSVASAKPKRGGAGEPAPDLIRGNGLLSKNTSVIIEEDDDIKDISSRVQKEIKRQLHEQDRKDQKDRLYPAKRQKSGDKAGYLVYKVPALPFYVTPYEQRDLIQLAGVFENANEAYASHGADKNLSKLIFGEQPITIQEILLVSKLLQENKIIAGGGVSASSYLYHLAAQEIYFNATLQRYDILLGYARHFFKGDVSFGLQLPVVMLHNTLKLRYNLTDTTKGVLNGTLPAAGVGGCLPFLPQYQNGFDNFIADILNQKGVDFNSKSTTIGFGDALMFLNCEFKSPRFDRGIIGGSLRVPTAKQRDTGKLWDPEKGNGGFTQTSLFASVLWAQHRFFNPYVYAQGTYSFPVSLQRRVPKYFKESLGDGIGLEGYLILGDNLRTPGTGHPHVFNTIDSTIRGFADGTTKVTINRGIEATVKVGNIIERVLFARGFLDLNYQFRFKGKDYIGGRRNDDEYNTSILTQNTNEVEHMIGAQFNYQHDENFRSWLGGRFAIAGSNVPRTLGIDVGVNIEF